MSSKDSADLRILFSAAAEALFQLERRLGAIGEPDRVTVYRLRIELNNHAHAVMQRKRKALGDGPPPEDDETDRQNDIHFEWATGDFATRGKCQCDDCKRRALGSTSGKGE